MRGVSGNRPIPFQLEYTQFWWDGADEGRLLIQQCSDCGVLRHPPGPVCAECHSFNSSAREALGTGTVHSFVVSHHPKHEGFDYPLVVVLIELDEGTRLVSGCDISCDEISIGQRVSVEWVRDQNGTSLPIAQKLDKKEGAR